MTFAASLDRMLTRYGQDITLRRIVGTTNPVNVDCTVRAFVRGYKPDELVGGVIQGDSHVIIAGADIDAAQWPGGEPVQSPPRATDPRVPRKGDKVIIEGRLRNVEVAAPVYMAAGDLLRVNLTVRG